MPGDDAGEEKPEVGSASIAQTTPGASDTSLIVDMSKAEIQEQLQQLDIMVHDNIDGIQQQIAELEKELGILTEKINAGPDFSETGAVETHMHSSEVGE